MRGLRVTRESKVEALLSAKIKELGGVCFKFVSPGNNGVPDRICALPGAVWFVELKTTEGELSPIQAFQIQRLVKLGLNTAVLYGKGDVETFIEMLKEQLR